MYLKLVFKMPFKQIGESENRHKGVTEIRKILQENFTFKFIA